MVGDLGRHGLGAREADFVLRAKVRGSQHDRVAAVELNECRDAAGRRRRLSTPAPQERWITRVPGE
ncbi:hypothetical protein GCM10027090_05460 [Sinomonas soli]